MRNLKEAQNKGLQDISTNARILVQRQVKAKENRACLLMFMEFCNECSEEQNSALEMFARQRSSR